MKNVGISNNNLDTLRKIRYSARDFISIKNDLNKFILEAFPEFIGADIGENTFVQSMIEMTAYANDQMNFYLDKTFNENILQRAIETKNVYDLAKGLGYSPRPIRPSVAQLNFQFDVPVTGSLTSQYFFTIPQGAQFVSNTQPTITFQNSESIIFDNGTASGFDSYMTTGALGLNVTRYSVSGINVISGNTQTFSSAISSAIPFRKIHIPLSQAGQPINDVISVTDSDGNAWYQVKSLAEEFIFTGIPNTNSDLSLVPLIITIKRVPRRYVLEFNDDGSIDIIFGSGETNVNETEFVLNPENVVFPNKTIGKFLDFSPDLISLSDFLNTTTLGVTPENVTIFVTYRTGGGIASNIGANTIVQLKNVTMNFNSIYLNQVERQYVTNSIIINNPEQAIGGEEAEEIEQIRNNASYWYAAQDRVVSITDYVARVATLPSQYGSVYKVVAEHVQNQNFDLLNQLTGMVQQLVTERQNGLNDSILTNQIINLNNTIQNNSTDVVLHVICRDNNGYLTKPTNTLMQNIQTYLNYFKVASDTLLIDSILVCNIGVRVEIHTDPQRFSPGQVQLNVINLVTNYLSLSNMEVGKNINIDDLIVALKTQVQGIVSMPTITFFTIFGNVDGRQYNIDYNNTIDDFLSYNGTIITAPNNCIFECKFPNYDILVRVVD